MDHISWDRLVFRIRIPRAYSTNHLSHLFVCLLADSFVNITILDTESTQIISKCYFYEFKPFLVKCELEW